MGNWGSEQMAQNGFHDGEGVGGSEECDLNDYTKEWLVLAGLKDEKK